jgi:integrase
MRGSIVKKDGRYYVVHDVFVDGKRKRKWTPAGATQAEADDKLTEVMGAVKRGVYVNATRVTVEKFLIEQWLPAARATVKPSTAELYATIIDIYVVPHIGGVRLQELRGSHLNRLYATLSTTGSRSRKPLAPKTIRNVHTLLHRACRDAVRWELVARNVTESADPPKVPAPAVAHWSADTVRAFLGSCEADRLFPLWHTIATTGLRRGEALALRWADLELDHGRASISRTLSWVNKTSSFTEPKTAKSRRVVPLPTETVAVLREHRKRQLRERLAAAEVYVDSGLVFAQEDGTPLPPKRISKAFGRAVERSGLPALTVHGLRHTFATVALGAGVQTKLVSDVLGHSSSSITADIYSHATEPMTRYASDQVAAALFGR